MFFLSEHQSTASLFHGVDKHFTFSSLYSSIKGPTSTTTDYSVAANFCCDQGMILEIDCGRFAQNAALHRVSGRSPCFDCQWLSSFTNEAEILFIGGSFIFEFKTIIAAPLGLNYQRYVNGINQMCHGMASGGRTLKRNKNKLSKMEKQMVFRLLSYALWTYLPNHPNAHKFDGCPNYMKQILKNHMNGIQSLCFYNHDDSNNQKFLDLLFKYDSEWINLDLLMTLFPNIELIEYTATGKDLSWLQQRSIYNSILAFIQKNKQTKLKEIYIEIDSMHVLLMKAYLMNAFMSEFKKYGWTIVVFGNARLGHAINPLGISRIMFQQILRREEILKNELLIQK